MRICVLATEYPSITETFISEPIQWLRSAGHDVSVIAHKRGNLPGSSLATHPATIVPLWHSHAAKLAAAAGAPASTLRLAGAARRWARVAGGSAAETLTRAMRPELREADCVLAHFGPTGVAWLAAAGLAERPYAVYIHGYDATKVLRSRPDYYRTLAASGARALTQSEFMRGKLVTAGFDRAQVKLVPYGVTPELARLALRGHAGPPTMLTIARLVEKKGLADSLTAFARAQPELGGRWRYRIVGDGPLERDLKRLTSELGVEELVDLSGALARPETLEAIAAARIFVLASKTAPSGDTEGSPVSILEAQTMGLPVISTLHAGIPETLPPTAAAEGYLVAEGDIEGLRRAIVRLATNDAARAEWADACRSHAQRYHSAEAHVEALVRALRGAAVPRLPAPAAMAR
jgi:glycosyltransferase involved in cell wall biosynthesis